MRLTLPTGRTGSALALGLVALALLLAWTVAVSPVLGWHAERAEALERQQTLARRMADLVGTLPSLRQQADVAASLGPPPNAVLQGATDAIATATLQQMVQDLARQADTSLSSTEALPAEQTGAYRRIGLRLAVSAPWPALVQLLQTIEQSQPIMLIDDLQLRGLRLQVGAGEPPLDASMVVYAFRAGTVVAASP